MRLTLDGFSRSCHVIGRAKCARVLAGDFSYLPKPYELEKLIEVLKDAYEARLKKESVADEATVEKILTLAPGENPFGILRKMRELDDSRRQQGGRRTIPRFGSCGLGRSSPRQRTRLRKAAAPLSPNG